MPNVPYPYEVNGKLVMGNGSLTPICSLSKRSLSPSLTVSKNLLWIMCNRMLNWNISHDIDGRYIMRHVINSKLSVKSLQVFKSVEVVLLECEKWDWCNFKGYYFSIFCGLKSWNEAHFSQDVWMTLVHSYLRCRKNLPLKIK